MPVVSAPTRRTVLGAAWSAPVIAVAIAAPAAAASEVAAIEFTNVSAYEGANPLTAYVNTAVKNLNGTPTEPVMLTIEILGNPVSRQQFNLGPLAAWGVSQQVRAEFPGLDAGTYTVVFTATAGSTTVTGSDSVTVKEW